MIEGSTEFLDWRLAEPLFALFIGGGPTRPNPTEGYYPAYFPSALDREHAQPLELVAGREYRSIDIRMRPTRAHSIQGQLVDEAGLPVSFLGVQLITGNIESSQEWGATTSAEDGTFTFNNIIPGDYTITAGGGTTLIPVGKSSGSGVGRLSLRVDGSDLRGVVVMTRPPSHLSGTAKLEDGTPVAAQIVLDFNEVSAQTARGLISGVADKSGNYNLSGLLPGTYLVHVNLPDERIYIKSIGGTFISPSSPFQILFAGQSLDGLEIILSRKTASVSGTLRSAPERITPGCVVLWPVNPTVWNPQAVQVGCTNSDANYVVDGVAPGRYYAHAWAANRDSLGDELFDSAFLKMFESDATIVDFEKSLVVRLDLQSTLAQALAEAKLRLR